MSAQNQTVNAETINEHTSEVITFNFSEQQVKVRTLMENGEIYFVGSDIAKTLGYKNSRKALNDHCKGVTKRDILTKGGKQAMNVILEGDVFRLIVNSKLPSAQKFESWVMDEVLPSLRKKGYYAMKRPKNDFIDACDVPATFSELNKYSVKTIEVDNELWFSLNDIHKAIQSTTGSSQSAKKLNAKRTLATKIHTFGATHPAWFTNNIGLQLILSGSRNLKPSNQLKLGL